MTILGRILMFLAIVLLIASFWVGPYSWQTCSTAIVLFFTAAAILGNAKARR